MRLLVVGLALVASATLAASAAAGDWLQFGFDSARSNAASGSTGITAANVGNLVRQQVKLDGVADSSAAYLRGVRVEGATHDTFFVTTSYGRTYAIDADSGAILWQFVPPGIGSFEHSAQITESSPLVDPDRTSIYTASPDGKIHRLAVSDGSQTTAGNWPAAVTLDAKHEKIASALNLSGNLVLVAVGSYFGFAPYQGHVVALDRRTGRIVHVFNASCSNRSGLLDPTTCPVSGPGMWARAGVVVEPGSGRLLVATANGLWNGRNAWADSVLELSPDAGKLIQSYTPANQSHLGLDDLDLGSTAPAILTAHVALQGGKDGKLRLLDLDRLNGQDARAREARRRAAAPVRTEGQGSADGARRLAFGRARLGVRRHVLRHRRLPPGRRPETAAAAGVGDGDRRLEPDRRRWPALRLQPAHGLAERLQPDLRQADRAARRRARALELADRRRRPDRTAGR